MAVKFKNNASATLASSINSSVTSISVSSGQGALFPSLSGSDYFYATLVDSSNNLEIVKVTARSSDTLTVVRGSDDTTARSYTAGDKVELRPVAAAFSELVAQSATATTSAAGIVQLTDSVASTSVTTAATPKNVKSAYDLANTANTTANAAMPKAGGTFTGSVTAPYYIASGSSSGYSAEDRADSSKYYTWYVSSNALRLYSSTGGDNLFVVDSSGNTTALGDVTAYSDERLKSDIQTIGHAVDIVNQLRGVAFVKDGKAGLGVIAQEVQEIIPQVVHENESGYLSVAYGNIVGVLIEALKEVDARLKAVEIK